MAKRKVGMTKVEAETEVMNANVAQENLVDLKGLGDSEDLGNSGGLGDIEAIQENDAENQDADKAQKDNATLGSSSDATYEEITGDIFGDTSDDVNIEAINEEDFGDGFAYGELELGVEVGVGVGTDDNLADEADESDDFSDTDFGDDIFGDFGSEPDFEPNPTPKQKRSRAKTSHTNTKNGDEDASHGNYSDFDKEHSSDDDLTDTDPSDEAKGLSESDPISISRLNQTSDQDQVQSQSELTHNPNATPNRTNTRSTNPTQSPSPSILTLEVGGEAFTEKDRTDAIWHEIKNSHVSGTHLTGILGKVENIENGNVTAVIDYKGQRIVIPIGEMMIALERPVGEREVVYKDRLARILNRMMGAEIDFVVRGIAGSGKERVAVASRKSAMLRLRRRYYFLNTSNGKPQVYPDRVVEARVTAVSQMAIRVEVFGVETSIRNRDLSWGYLGDARDRYSVGDIVQVRVTRVNGDSPESLGIRADIRSLTVDTTRDRLMTLKPQTNCMGKITDIRQGVMFISLVDGVRAISHRCFDNRKPGRGDDVLFVVTKIDEESGTALGIISRIVKRNI